MFKGKSIREFNDYFTCEDDCRRYLFKLKWKDGFSCFRCGCSNPGKGHTSFHLRCKDCQYEESIIANTSLHKLKIPLLKAFGIVYRLTIPHKSSSCEDLAIEYKVNPKSAWAFAHKVRRAMVLNDGVSELTAVLKAKVIDSVIICGGKKILNGLQQVHVSIGQTGSRQASGGKPVVKYKAPEVPIKTNCELHLGKFIKQRKDIRLWNFKTSLTGVNRRCSIKYIQCYIDEYFYRAAFKNQKHLIFHNILVNLIKRKPAPVKGFAAK